MREKYNEYDKFSGLYREKRKPSFLVIVLIGLLLLLVCSLGYDNIVKPYLAKRAEQKSEQTKKERNVESEILRQTITSTPSKSENRKELSTIELMERRNHAEVVKQAKRAGVSSEGTTLEIMERINRKELEKYGY